MRSPRAQADRPLPSALDSEKGVLSSILIEPDCLSSIDGITPSDFHHPAHQAVFGAMLAMNDEGQPIDLITLTQALNDQGRLAAAGGAAAIAELQNFAPTSRNIAVYAAAIKEKAALRKCIAMAGRAIDSAYAGEFPADELSKLSSLAGEAEIETDTAASLFVDLSGYLDGTITQEIPTIAEVIEGKALFYQGRLNELHAEPSTGKTNILMAACIAEIEKGGKILYIDPEDTPKGFSSRMLSLGASPSAIRDQISYLHNPTPEEIIKAQEWARENHPSMVTLDGLAESMAAQGMNEDKAQEVLTFFRDNLRPFAEAGAAVIIADHVTKSTEGRGQFARGSGAKAGRYDGISYEVVTGKAYSPKDEGFVKLKIQKDRNGGAGKRGDIYAELHFTPGIKGRTIISFREPSEKPEGPFRPTAIMDKITARLEVIGEASKRELRTLGKSQWVDTALEILLEDGVVKMKEVSGKHLYSLKS